MKEEIEATIEQIIQLVDDQSKTKMFLRPALRGIIKGLIEVGRISVLKDFDAVCAADAFIGFSEAEFAAVKKFFAVNKSISNWDK